MKPHSEKPFAGPADVVGTDNEGLPEDVTELRFRGQSLGDGKSPPPRVLKHRFVLDVQLGSGGMGTVYRAKDLRKVEARDRNPYVAVKVLNNDFRKHPDAFIALQREASKSQTLAHPNIVSIFDFDKDGDTPFMTMELLKGQELAQLLKQNPTGLPKHVAWSVIRGMCAGLKRAHDAGITHADFKPGNVFVTTENQAKILDFGIARAVQTRSAGGTDDTRFDPQKLAALTPAYASLEMLQGATPEPRDDIYALGVCIYQILSGRHPFDRAPADQAEAEGLLPLRQDGLSRRQWLILQSMLAFRRQDRPVDMDRVIERLHGTLPLRTKLLAGALVLASLLGGAAVVLDYTALDEVRRIAARDALIAAQVRRIDDLLAVAVFDHSWQQRLLQEFVYLSQLSAAPADIDTARRRILGVYLNRLSGQKDVADAIATLKAAQQYSSNGHFAVAEAFLHRRLLASLNELLDHPRADPDWLQAVESQVARFQELFPKSPVNAELKNECGEVYLMASRRLLQSAAAGSEIPRAEALYQAAQPLVFDFDALEALRKKLASVREALRQRTRKQAEQADERAFQNALTVFLQSASCRSDSLESLAGGLQALQQQWPAFSSSAQTALVSRLAHCISEVAGYDQDKALSLRNDAIRVFGDLKPLRQVKIDPCGMHYLIGNGTESGRSGFCSDDVAVTSKVTVAGPRLVVVPGAGNGRFAIGKYEIDGNQLSFYCVATHACTATAHGKAPVVGIESQLAEDYAAWLSNQTGYHYRLPRYSEWLQAAADSRDSAQGNPRQTALDPNRNCAVSVAGVERGLRTVAVSSGAANRFGLVNMLGNVREWVTQGSALYAAGGSFKDPIANCNEKTLIPHDGHGDGVTGFRLLREIP